MEELFICGGLGDCLLYCQIYDIYRETFIYSYVLNVQFINVWKTNSEIYCETIKKIFNLFNVPLKIKNVKYIPGKEIEPKTLLIKYPLQKLSLKKSIKVL